MPHAAYRNAMILCPWPGCAFRIEMIDFQMELAGNPPLYAQVVLEWGQRPGYGLNGRCPGCQRYVLFGVMDKKPVDDPNTTGLPILPDDWHLKAFIA